jgi:hypothetical protein
VALQEVIEGDGIGEAEDLGFVDRFLELPGVEDGGEVEERAVGRRDGNAAVDGRLVRRKARAVDLDPRPSVVCHGKGRLDALASRCPNAPKRTRRPMAEDSLRPHCQDGRQPTPFPRNDAMTDRIHRAIEGMQTAARESTIDRAWPDPRRHELPARDDSVLAVGEHRDPGVNVARVRFFSYIVVNCILGGHRAMVAQKV